MHVLYKERARSRPPPRRKPPATAELRRASRLHGPAPACLRVLPPGCVKPLTGIEGARRGAGAQLLTPRPGPSGVCISCDGISAPRLRVVPEALRCTRCQEEAERAPVHEIHANDWKRTEEAFRERFQDEEGESGLIPRGVSPEIDSVWAGIAGLLAGGPRQLDDGRGIPLASSHAESRPRRRLNGFSERLGTR